MGDNGAATKGENWSEKLCGEDGSQVEFGVGGAVGISR